MNKQIPDLSFLTPENTGGIYGAKGYNDQAAYTCLRAIEYLQNENFEYLQPEGQEDLDVFFRGENKNIYEMHQVKNYQLKKSDLKAILCRFSEKSSKIQSHSCRLVISSYGYSTQEIRKLVKALEQYKGAKESMVEETISDTKKGIIKIIKKLQLEEYTEIILESTEFFNEWETMKNPAIQLEWLRGKLEKYPPCKDFDYSLREDIIKRLHYCIQNNPRCTWDKSSLSDLINSAINKSRKKSLKDLNNVIVVHQWSKNYGEIPWARAQDGVEEYLNTEDIWFRPITIPYEKNSEIAEGAQELVESISDPKGILKTTLDKFPVAQVFLLGVCEIPFAFLAGFLLSDIRELHLIENDRALSKYRWKKEGHVDGPKLEIVNKPKNKNAKEVAICVSFSNATHKSYADVISEDTEVLHFQLDKTEKDLLASPLQLSEYADVIRKGYEQEILDECHDVELIHLFLATPMTLVYKISSIFKSNDMPKVRVYFYKRPKNRWYLEINPSTNRFTSTDYTIGIV